MRVPKSDNYLQIPDPDPQRLERLASEEEQRTAVTHDGGNIMGLLTIAILLLAAIAKANEFAEAEDKGKDQP